MSRFEMKLPDVGEGVAEAELVEWRVGVGDSVTPDTVIAEVLTDKATVEISAPVTGEVAELHGEPGDVLAVGGILIGFDTDRDSGPQDAAPQDPAPQDPAPQDPEPSETAPLNETAPSSETAPSDNTAPSSETIAPAEPPPPPVSRRPPADGARATAAPAVRARAGELGLDLSSIEGSGPEGRVMHEDLDRKIGGAAGAGSSQVSPPLRNASAEGQAVPVRGVRRRIAERLSQAWSEIPHITYVDEVDVTELERVRAELNSQSDDKGVRLTVLPFLARAIVVAAANQPGLNAHYDHSAEILTRFDAVHIGIATQTEDGLRVPVVRHAEGRGVWSLARELARVTEAARSGSATRDELTGSTITITSLGALGGLATTPIINPPEVAIIGVNKIATRPVWRDGSFQPRQVMNLSSSFDHRMVDGWDAATFVAALKRLLETPALLFATDA